MTQVLAAAAAALLLSVDQIAQTCHETNRAYCASQGDDSQPAWADAPDWQKQSAIAGVQMHLANPDATPEDSHVSWFEQKKADGWKYGKTKDPEKKLHPCMVAYDKLPPEQKAKDYIFRGVVHALAAFQAPEAAPPAAPIVKAAEGFAAVKYIGKRDTYKEGAYGTGVVFARGETKMIPAAKAALLLKHPDVYVAGDAGEATSTAAPVAGRKDTTTPEEERVQEMRDSIANMDKDALEMFCKTNFNTDIDKRHALGELRALATRMVDQFGVA